MKTSFWVIILVTLIASSVIVAFTFEFPFEKEHYDIEITGLKDVYLVGEPYSFSYTISGYGYACASQEITYPDENGNTLRTVIDADCRSGAPKTNFIIYSENNANIKPIEIQNPGRYNVGVLFEKSPPSHIEPTQSGKEFHVVEKICNDSKPKNKAQCFEDAYYSCTSAYGEFAMPTGEGDAILYTGVVESWFDCSLRVYSDHTQDRYKGHSDGTRSICDGITIDDESIIFENCNNEDIPPLKFDKQYYLHKEKCEIYGGYWDFDFATCFDFSDEYDCEELGGELVSRAYTGEQPDYSKKSHSFVCKFTK